MDTLRISINELHPGAFPKKTTWERYSQIPNERFRQEYYLTPFGVAMLSGVGYFVLDGNHRVARLYEVGVNEIMYFQRSLTSKDEGLWKSRIEGLHRNGIFNFADFLRICQPT